MQETTYDLLERAERALREAEALRRQNEFLVANARRLTTPAKFEKLRNEIYGPTEAPSTAPSAR